MYVFGKLRLNRVLLGVAALVLSGCSVGSSSGGGSSAPVDNISGKVSQTSSSSLSKPTMFGKAMHSMQVSAFAESGCQMQARNITTSAIVSTTTSDSSGNYTFLGVNAGDTYKVIAICGSNTYSSVATAVNSDVTSISDSDRVQTNPRSSVIAAFIVDAILQAVESAVATVPAAAQDAVKAAILASLDSVIQTITASIDAAIDSGAMEEPDVTDASNVSAALKDATNSTATGTAVAAAPPPPASVTQAVEGAKTSSIALQACDTNYSGTATTCTQAMAGLMYNVLGFPVGIKTAGGAFTLAGGTCTKTTTISNISDPARDTLGEFFPNAKFITSGDDPEIPAGFCAVIPEIAAPDRNRGYENDGDDHGPVFTETGNLDGIAGDETGVLTALATSIMAGHTYNLASIDNLVFNSVSGAGINARLVNKRFTPGAGLGTTAYFYRSAGGVWTADSWVNNCQPGGFNSGGGTSPCDFWNLNFNFSGAAWSTAANNNALATAIGNGSNAGLGVFEKTFGGPVPAQNEIDSYIDQGRVHLNYNPSGSKEMQFITTAFPSWAAGANPCFDNDPSTACLDNSGNPIAPQKVDLTMGALDATEKVKPISTITGSNSGAYYMRPYWGMNGFSGLIGFVKASDGLIVRDEKMRDRALKIIFAASECGQNGLPVAGANCAVNDIFNVAIDWSGCGGGGGSNCPAYKALTGSPTKVTKTSLTLQIQSNYKTTNQMYCSGGGCWSQQLVGYGDWSNLQPYKFTVTVNGGARDSLTYANTGLASAAGEYNLAPYYDCSSSPCQPSGFVLIGSNGAPLIEDNGATVSMGYPGGTWSNVGNFTAAEINAAAGADFDPNTGGMQANIATAAANYSIATGPIRNPNFKCDGEPFFVDGNGNGILDCEVSGGYSQASASSGDISFSGDWEYQNWKQDPSLSGAQQTARAALPFRPRDNGYEFGDPVGTKKLLSTAFNGWFDGAHTLSSTTNLNALQVFALVYMFFSQGGESRYIDGIVSGYNEFIVEAPIFSDGGQVPAMNQAIGKSFTQFKTN